MKDLSTLEKVGEGAQGVVYKTQWKDKVVVYKQMKSLLANTGEEKKDYTREFTVWRYVLFNSSFLSPVIIIV